jgi:hypothetical protein
VIGLLHSGDAVKTITTKGDWTEIEAPTSAYAFMAAQYLKQGPAEASRSHPGATRASAGANYRGGGPAGCAAAH